MLAQMLYFLLNALLKYKDGFDKLFNGNSMGFFYVRAYFKMLLISGSLIHTMRNIWLQYRTIFQSIFSSVREDILEKLFGAETDN